jgi:hypothetical protein
MHGNLNIRGDAAANVIVLDQSGLNADQVRISGASGTAINNQANPVILSGVTRGVDIRMGAGADSVTMSSLSLPGNVSVDGQKGANILTLNNVQVARSLNIHNSTTTTIANTTVGKDLRIGPGSGVENVALRSVEVQRNTKIVGGRWSDIFTVDNSIFHGAVRLYTGQGADDTLQFGVTGQTGTRAVFSNRVRFDGGRGYDTLLNFDASTYIRNSQFRIVNFESNTPIPDTTAPTVSFTAPASNATDVALNQKIAATFSEPMDPLTITTTSFTVTGPESTPVIGTVTYVGTTATFTPTSSLATDTTFTATVTTGAEDLAGNALASNFTWTFTTGETTDITAPTVSSTDPLNGATGVARNKKIAAIFSEAMDPLTITAASVTVTAPGLVPVIGTVTCVGATMAFTPTSALAPDTTFTATVTTGAKDLAGNPLASNFTWTFTTGATSDATAPTVTSTNPDDLQTDVAINKTVAGTFSESMDPLTITTANFTVTGPGNTPVTGTVNYDALSKIATFTPSSNLATDTTFTATIAGGISGVKDLAGNPLASDKVWTFTTGTQMEQATINLGSAGAFAVMATASITSTGPTQINGDVGLNPGSSQGILPSEVNGTIHVDDQAIITAQADLLAAYNDAVSRSVSSVSLPGNMGGLTFTPGLYTNSTSVLISGAGPGNIVTLDAQGDPNAIFIFKMGSTLTTGPGAQVVLAGGAKAGNIFWQVGTSATLDTTTIFMGNILAAVTITVNTGSVVEGRLLGGSNSDGSVTINASTITVPAL